MTPRQNMDSGDFRELLPGLVRFCAAALQRKECALLCAENRAISKPAAQKNYTLDIITNIYYFFKDFLYFGMLLGSI